jgi:phosphate uptake regulator
MSRKDDVGNAGDKKSAESRKLVKWGSSETLIMSLPRNWVKKFQLNKDSEVSIIENQDGSLLVSPLTLSNERPRFEATIPFSAEDMEDMDLIELEITVKYLDGNDVITVERKEGKGGGEKFPTKFTLKVQEVAQSLLGLEITSLLSTKIKIQDIMNIHETNVDVLVKIIADTTVDLFQNICDIVKEGDYPAHMDSLLISKKQVRKYFLRILRELRKGLLVPATLSRMGLSAQDTVDLAFYITDISGVADDLEFAFKAMAAKKNDPEKKVIDLVVSLMQNVYGIFKKGVDSFLFKTKKDAVSVIKTAPSIEQLKREIENTLDHASTSGQYTAYEILLDILSKILDHTISIAMSSCRRIM